jgi:outer membrane receptor protein involved in Fe transport
MKKAVTLLVSLFFCLPAQSDELDSLLNMSLEDLLNVKFSVASTKPETIIETPAIVSRYNRTDLEKMGVTTLREMFNFIPGVIVQDSLGGWASVQIRGIDENFNQKVLFLLDSVPYHQPSHSMIPMEGIPWESISHVEVIRGPGAVFYGSQASGGVLNVITRKGNDASSASFKMGSNGLYEGSAYYNKKLTDKSDIYIAAEYREEDGYTATYNEVFPEVGLITDEIHRYIEKTSGLLRYSNDKFILQLHAFSDATVGINDAYTNESTLQPIILKTEGQLIHIENTWSVSNSKITLFSDYNHYTFGLQLHNLFAPGVHAIATKEDNGNKDYRFRYGGSIVHNVNESLDIVAGVEQETRSIDYYGVYSLNDQSSPLVTLLEEGKVDEFSAYTQFDYSFKNWRFLIGGRYTDNEISGKKTTPRVALVYKFDDHQSIKALYSTGFNSPNPTQTSINLPGDVVGNTDLTAEVVKTFDIAYSYSKNNALFVANIYSLEADDFIQRRFSEADNSNSFFNEGNFKRSGAELDFQIFNNGNKLFANAAYQKEGNKIDNADTSAFNTPKFTMSIGASTDVWENHSIGGDLAYIGARHNLKSHSVFNINYTARLSSFDLFIVIRNIFNKDILNPDISTQNSTLVAQGEKGVNAQAGIRAYF